MFSSDKSPLKIDNKSAGFRERLTEFFSPDIILVACVGWLAAARPLADNSLFTHIATGRYIWETRSVPTVDIYSFVAEGQPWVVQSWLVSLLYGAATGVADGWGIRILAGLVGASTLVLGWRLLTGVPFKNKPEVFAPVALTAVVTWTARPTLWGILLLVVTIAATRRSKNPWWLVFVGAIWVNVHGSWLLGLAAVAIIAVADFLDQEPSTKKGLTAVKCLLWLTVGLVAGAFLGPLGGSSLTFPFSFTERTAQLQTILEWRSFRVTNLVFVALVVQAVVVVFVKAKYGSWRGSLLTAVFSVGIALLAIRNVQLASFIMLAPLATLPAARNSFEVKRKHKFLSILAVTATVAVFFVLPSWDFSGYPVRAVDHIRQMQNPPERLFAPVPVNNYIELKSGTDIKIFVDDRFDMYPIQQIDAFTFLNDPEVAVETKLVVIEQYNFDAVLIGKETLLAEYLLRNGWEEEFSDTKWVLLLAPGFPIDSTG